MSSSLRALAVVLIGLAPLLLGCGQAQKQAAPPPPTVTLAKPFKRTIVDQDEYVGRFVPVYSVEMRARVSGYLDKSDTLVDAPMAVSAIHPDEQARVAAAWEASLAGFPASSSNSSWPMKSKKKSGNTAGSSARSASDARPTGVWSLLTTIPNTYQAPFQVHLGSVPDEPEGPKGEP
jgi:hypothetical protein